MKFQGSIIKEQGITFGILIVKPSVLQSTTAKQQMNNIGHSLFGLMPIILMAQNYRGVPTYYGRTDIVRFLSRVPINRIPWKEYTVG